jgi:hypothetical protein
MLRPTVIASRHDQIAVTVTADIGERHIRRAHQWIRKPIRRRRKMQSDTTIGVGRRRRRGGAITSERDVIRVGGASDQNQCP